jgi:hypothetical protein
MSFDPIVSIPSLLHALTRPSPLGEKIMSYDASIYRHVYNPPITPEVLRGIAREQRWQPGTIVNSAQSQFEIETQHVIDRLLRECFTRKSPRGTGQIDTP